MIKNITEEEAKKLQQEYEEKRKLFSEPKYFSKFSESSRVLKIIRTKYAKTSIEKVFYCLLSMLAQDMHPELKYENLQNDGFYRAGKKNKKRYMHLAHFNQNKEVTLEWFTDESWIVKNFYFDTKWAGKYTKIIYLVIIKGLEPKSGYLGNILQSRYVKAENLRFDIQMLTLMHKLNLSKMTDEKFNYKISDLNLKLSKIHAFSK